MDRAKLKDYAPQARRDFIRAVTDRASLYGLSAKTIEPVTKKGDVAIIAGRAFPAAVVPKRKALENRIEHNGFAQTMEALAYTWFNRFVAIRYMELHGHLDHGYRVLSNPDPAKTIPEVLDHAEHVDLEGLNKEKAIELKLDGGKEVELYQMLLVAQCNALHSALPFLFERIDDETELVLPDNLLHSDSIIRKLVNNIEEEDWKEVEVIGWLYQFYIAEKKDEVIGKVVASEDIPAATQLFTPNWIVKYLVQNTLGRQWLATYPRSPLRQQMQYYIEPAEQTAQVQEQLKAITPTALNPEELTLLDPACGSGHILVEAYDLFKAIYQERGYRAKDIPALILQKNLFGLEIDDRAAQLAAFALMMKARADDRRIFASDAKPRILAFQNSQGMNATDITLALNSPISKEKVPREYLFEEIEEERDGLFSKKALAEKGDVSKADIASLLALFENAKTFGSLIQVPSDLATKLPEIQQRLNDISKHGDLAHVPAYAIRPLLYQAQLLTKQYDEVTTNPPYMGGRYLNRLLRDFAKASFPETKSDLFAFFIERSLRFLKPNRFLAAMTPFTWMFLGSYKEFRRILVTHNTLCSLIQPEYHAFFDSAYVPICCYVVMTGTVDLRADYVRLGDFYGESLQPEKALEAISNPACTWRYSVKASDLSAIEGIPIAYWATDAMRRCFRVGMPLKKIVDPKVGLQTGDNNKFLRRWFEVDLSTIGFACGHATEAIASLRNWFPYNKGGEFRRWYGNQSFVIDWANDGKRIREFNDQTGKPRIQNADYYFVPCVSWSKISSGLPAFRYFPKGFVFDVAGTSIYSGNHAILCNLLGFANSIVARRMLEVLSPTLNFEVGHIGALPIADGVLSDERIALIESLISAARADWNNFETSWDFTNFPLLRPELKGASLEASWATWKQHCDDALHSMRELETANNRSLIASYNLQDELSPEIPEDQITLARAEIHEDVIAFISYALGCIMGRYCLDVPGLILASAGDGLHQYFAKTGKAIHQLTFTPDNDGIVPILDNDWFENDVVTRVREFLRATFGGSGLPESIRFIEESLGKELRNYFLKDFYSDHLQTYKNRPIYWLFSSGKQRALQCLVYLHRYNEGTLSKMRTEYVIPLRGKLASRTEQLIGEIQKATATSHRKKLEKERDTLIKQQAELNAFDEKLRHYADLRIKLDLDDGVRVNYGKFGDLLAEVNAVTGGNDD